jgi:hypothetical protein
VARIKIVKEQKANAVEEMIVKMAQSGQIREKVSEKQLICWNNYRIEALKLLFYPSGLMMMIIRISTFLLKIVMIRAFVLGSLNIDQVLSLDHIVKESETLTVFENKQFLGGKGANQAVAIALSGAETVLVANVGINDVERLIKQLTEYQITPRLSTDILTGQAIMEKTLYC